MPPKKDKKKGGGGGAVPEPVQTKTAAEATVPEEAPALDDPAIIGEYASQTANAAAPAAKAAATPEHVLQSAVEGPMKATLPTETAAPSPVRKAKVDIAADEHISRGSIVAVTGASGFIGSHIVQALLAEGYHVRACVRDGSPTSEKNQMLLKLATGQPGSITLVKGELDVAGSYDEAFTGCAAVVHSAAVVDIEQVDDPYATIVKPAVDGTRNVLASAVAAGTVKRFVITSSCIAVQIHDQPLDYVFTEKDWNTWSTVENGDAYGYAKTQAEKLVWACVDKPDGCMFDAVSINPGIVLGEVLCKMHTKSSAVLLRQAIYNNPVLNYPATFVDVKDVARMHVRSLQIAAAGGHRFIATCDHEPMNTEELSKIAQRLLPQYKLQSQPMYPPFKWALAKAAHHATLGNMVLNQVRF